MRRAAFALSSLAVAGALGVTAASCARERVRTASIVIEGDGGGALNGFACVDRPTDVGATRACLDGCTSRCFDACNEESLRERDAGTPPGTVIADNDRCLQGCLAALKQCNDACTSGPAPGEGPPLAARANGQTVCVTLDFVRLGGEIECRSMIHLLDWCTARSDRCAVIARRTACVSGLADVPADAGLDAAAPVIDANYAKIRDALLEELAVVAPSAPDEWILVRMMGTTQDAASLADTGRVDLDRVVGCAVSCPVLLSTRDSVELAVDVGTRGTCTSAAVRACAALGTPDLPAAADALSAQ
jgi:hypothetical protein